VHARLQGTLVSVSDGWTVQVAELHDLAVSGLPSGTVTFLFSDVEGSTRLLGELGAEGYARALAEHRRVLRAAFAAHGGVEVDTQGDAFFVSFIRASDAVAAASAAQTALARSRIRVRMGLHTGEPMLTDAGYVGIDVHRAARVAAVGHGGQVLLSQATRELVDAELRDLGEHRLKDLSAPERLYQLGTGDFPPLKTLYRTNLPIPVTPFVGRADEVSEVVELLVRGDLRLLTLTGPGGIGKTRLALQAAAEVAGRYPDGVFFVALAPLLDPALLPLHVAHALDAERDLAAHVADKRLLLLLDNFEHVIDAAPHVAGVLRACPRLDVLVTSRERLQVEGEHEWAVPPLAPPDALALFAQRARAVGVEVEPAEAAEMCARLDNLPLALELAAARTKLFAPSQLLERLSQRLDLLKGGRDADPRQETLRATIDWSYDLLTAEEQRLFARLSVFAGGSTIESVEAVCDASADVLASLVDKSLIRKSGERIWMLETVRGYAAERLDCSGEADAVRRHHAEHFVALAERVGVDVDDAGDITPWLTRLDAEVANLRAALIHLSDAGETELVARAATPLWRYWAVRNLVEGRMWLERAIGTADAKLRANAFYGSGILAMRIGDLPAATAAANEAAVLHRELGDDRGAARSTVLLGMVAMSAGHPDEAFALYERAAKLMHASGDRAGLATALGQFGYLALLRGDYDETIARVREAAALHRELGRRDQLTIDLINLGYALLGKHDDEAARASFAEALGIARELGDALETAYCLEGFAAAAAGARPKHAARLLGAADAARESGGGSLDQVEHEVHARTLEAARARLGAEGFEQAWEHGRALPTEQAVALALDSSG
jgi:predicted ATPase/class 3 adenylate cyclase